MTDRGQLKFKRNCIYCFAPGRQSKEHVFPRAIGYRLPVRMVCEKCNNDLGALDAALSEDYWIRLRRGEVPEDPVKSPHMRITRNADGSVVLHEPHTDPMSWRAVAKTALEVLAFIIQGNVFKPAFDEWRDFVRFGRPGLADPKSKARKMRRGSLNPGKWKDRHIIKLDGDKDHCFLYLALFRSYEFFCFFDHPFPENEDPVLLTVDLSKNELAIWTQPDQDQPPQIFAVLPAP